MTELVALMNAYHRFNESIDFLSKFEKLISDQLVEHLNAQSYPFSFTNGRYFYSGLLIVLFSAIKIYFKLQNNKRKKL